MNKITIIKSDRKTVSIQVDTDSNIIVRAPKSMKKNEIDKFLEKYRDWLNKKTKQMAEKYSNTHKYEDGEIFYLLGKEKILKFKIDTEYAFEHKNDQFVINSLLSDQAEGLINTFYKKNAKHFLIKRGWEVAEQVKLKPSAFKISSAEKRWGSCSGRGNINLSYHLMPLPTEIIDYVIVHELAHLLHMDHSKEFWETVEKMLPDYEKRLKWLNDNSAKFKI